MNDRTQFDFWFNVAMALAYTSLIAFCLWQFDRKRKTDTNDAAVWTFFAGVAFGVFTYYLSIVLSGYELCR